MIEAHTSLQGVMKELPGELYDLLIRKIRIDDAVEDFSRHGRELAKMEMKLNEMANTGSDRAAVADYAAKVEKFKQQPIREAGLTQERVEAEQRRVNGLIEKNPIARQAAERHKALVNEIGTKLVKLGLINPDMRESYFPHVIADYIREDGRFGGLPRGKGLSRPTAGNWKAREGTLRDTSGDYIKVMSQYLADTYEALVKRELAEEIGIRNHLTLNPRKGYEEIARNWKPGDPVPEGYTEYDLNKGYEHIGAKDAGQRLIGQYINDAIPDMAKLYGLPASELSDYVRSLLGKRSFARSDPFEGGRKISYSRVLIPKEVANEMQIMAARDVELNPIARAFKTYTQGSKSLIIHKAPIQYNVRNFVGDFQAAYAYFGNEMFHGDLWKRAIKEVTDANFKHIEAPDWQSSNYYGVSSSGRTALEVTGGGAYQLPDFKRFSPSPGKSMPRQAAWLFKQLPRIATVREDIMRHYVYLMNMERHRAGKPMLRANVSYSDFSGLIADSPERAAGKIARKPLGDYGDFTVAEDFLRNGPIPFYSWIKINLPRWVHDVPKAVMEGATGPKEAAISGGSAALKGTAALLIGLSAVRAWNGWVMGDAEDSLPKNVQDANHFIFPDLEASEREGRPIAKTYTDADGKKRVAVIAIPDAVDHVAELLGTNGLPADLMRVARGRMNLKEAMYRLRENTIWGDEQTSVKPLPAVSRDVYNNLAPLFQGLDAFSGVKRFPDPLKPHFIPQEERVGALISAAGGSGLPGTAKILGALDPTSTFDQGNESINFSTPGLGIPRQFGYREYAPAMRPEYLTDLEGRIKKLKGEIPATVSRMRSMIAGFKSPQAMPADRRAMVQRMLRSVNAKVIQLNRLAERKQALSKAQNASQSP